MKRRTSKIWEPTKEEFQKIVDNSNSFSEILRYFGLGSKGGNFKTLHNRIKEEEISIEGLEKRRKNIVSKQSKSRKIPLEDVLVKNSNYSRHLLKQRLIEKGYLEEKCKECGIGNKWNGKDLVLHLDHENGDSKDNRLENLRLLCPNCHSQTPTYAGRNNTNESVKKIKCTNCSGFVKRYSSTGLCETCYKYKGIRIHKKYNEKDSNSYIKKCIDCDNAASRKSTSGMCRECYLKNTKRKNNRPSKNELMDLVIELGYSEVGRKFNVSGNAVKKWCKYYDIYDNYDFKIKKEKMRVSKTKTGLKGVRYYNNKFYVEIWYDGKTNYYGSFDNKEEAARLADKKMVEIFGKDVINNERMGLI